MIKQVQLAQNCLQTIFQQINNRILSGQLHIAAQKQHIEYKNNQESGEKSLSNQSNTPMKRQRSSLSLQDRKLLHKLTRKLNTFQGLLKDRSDVLKKVHLQNSKQELNQIIQKRKIQSQQNKQKVLHRKLVRNLRRQQQQQKKRQVKLNQSKLTNKSRLYIITEAEHRQKMLEEQKQRQKLLTIISQHKNSLVKISKIKEYESQYFNYLRLQKQERRTKLLKLRSQKALQEFSRSKSTKSKSYMMVQQEKQNERSRLEEEARSKELKKTKLKQFLSKIERPIVIVDKKQSKQQTISPPSKRVERSYTQQKQIGNKFMKQSFNALKLGKQKAQLQRQSTTIDESTRPAKHHDYLRQMKQKRLQTQMTSKESLLSNNKTTISRILNSADSTQQKMQKIKRLAHQLQAGIANEDPYVQIQKIKAKMFILQAALKNQGRGS